LPGHSIDRTCRSAVESGRRHVGIELREAFAEASRTRLASVARLAV
jgi:hypothetical protein